MLPIRGLKKYKEGGTATVSVYSRWGKRLGTVYLGQMPEQLQPTFRRSRLSFDGLLVSNGVGSYCGNPCCVMAHEFVNWA